MQTEEEALIAERPRYRWALTLVNQVRRMTGLMRFYRNHRAKEEHHLQASSYAGALQYEPVGRFADFARQKIVTSELPFQGDLDARDFEKLNQPLDAFYGCNRIHPTR